MTNKEVGFTNEDLEKAFERGKTLGIAESKFDNRLSSLERARERNSQFMYYLIVPIVIVLGGQKELLQFIFSDWKNFLQSLLFGLIVMFSYFILAKITTVALNVLYKLCDSDM